MRRFPMTTDKHQVMISNNNQPAGYITGVPLTAFMATPEDGDKELLSWYTTLFLDFLLIDNAWMLHSYHGRYTLSEQSCFEFVQCICDCCNNGGITLQPTYWNGRIGRVETQPGRRSAALNWFHGGEAHGSMAGHTEWLPVKHGKNPLAKWLRVKQLTKCLPCFNEQLPVLQRSMV